VTQLRSHLAHAAISYDGSTAAFADDQNRTGFHDISIVNLMNGAVSRTGLLDRVNTDPDSSPPATK
jgi:hypothetical protein